MKFLTISARTGKEILRDPLNLAFGLGFPVVLLLLMSAIQANVPVPLFEIGKLAPGTTVFGLSFMALFSSVLLSKDRESALLQRLYTAPLRAGDFILGYLLPMLPISLGQTAICYLLSLLLGLPWSSRILLAILANVPAALLFASIGLLCGSVCSSKQVGGICGALLTNLSAWLSGIWFDLDLVGGVFKKLANALPFVHAVELERAILNGASAPWLGHLLWVLGYALAFTVAAILLFLRQMKK